MDVAALLPAQRCQAVRNGVQEALLFEMQTTETTAEVQLTNPEEEPGTCKHSCSTWRSFSSWKGTSVNPPAGH